MRVARWGDANPGKVTYRFWKRMGERYGHRWTSQYGDDPFAGGREWFRALCGLTLDQIKHGFEMLPTRSGSDRFWPPAVDEFVELALGIPPIDLIRAELTDRNAQRTAWGLAVLHRLDTWNWKSAEAKKADAMLAQAYAAARAHFIMGGELPAVLPALPDESDREPTWADPKVAEAAIAQIREML